MNKKTLLAAAGIAAILSTTPAIADATPSTTVVATGMSRLGFNLFAKLAPSTSDQNMLMSPLSIDEALGLLYYGARGATQEKCASVMGLSDLTISQTNTGFADFNKSMSTIDSLPFREGAGVGADPAVQVDLANAIWPDTGEKLDAEYVERCHRYLGATVQPLNFNDPDAAASKINSWVDENTHHNITSIVSPKDIQQVSVVLTNAVYFHGKWTTPFKKTATVDANFETPGGPKNVPMMHRDGTMDFVNDPTFQAVSLPYGNGSLRMLIALPARGDDVPGMVDGDWWSQTLDRLKPTEITLGLPRFKAEYFADITKPMHDLGIPLIGDYSGIDSDGRLQISKILHKATVDVDEEGTVASAATAIIMTKSLRLAGVKMIVDRPFFFAIYDLQTRAVLFNGLVRDPVAS